MGVVRRRLYVLHPDRQDCGLARIMLSLACVPRIGAFRFRDDGPVTLDNLPVDCTMRIFENDGTTHIIPEGRTYLDVEAYVADLFRLHSARFLIGFGTGTTVFQSH